MLMCLTVHPKLSKLAVEGSVSFHRNKTVFAVEVIVKIVIQYSNKM